MRQRRLGAKIKWKKKMFNSKINSSSINGLSAVLRDLCARMFSRQMIGDQHNIRCYTRDDRVSLFQAALVRRGCNKKQTRQTSNIFFFILTKILLFMKSLKSPLARRFTTHHTNRCRRNGMACNSELANSSIGWRFEMARSWQIGSWITRAIEDVTIGDYWKLIALSSITTREWWGKSATIVSRAIDRECVVNKEPKATHNPIQFNEN